MNDPRGFYSYRLITITAQLKAVKQRSRIVSAARLFVFLLLAFCTYFYFTRHQTILLFATLLSTVVFIALIRISVSLKEKKSLITQLLFINENEAGIMDFHDNLFDAGTGISNTPMHATDLDIFGKGSLYHVLNRTTTEFGTRSLAHLLNHSLTSTNNIVEHQQALAQLSPQAEARQLITANGLLQDTVKNDVGDLIKWLETPDRIASKKWILALRFLLPVAAVAGILLYLSDGNPILLGLAIIANWLLIGSFARYTLMQHTLIGRKEMVLQQYASILKAFSNTDAGNSTLLQKVVATALNAIHEILALSKLSALFDQRLNLLVGIFANSFLAYDIHIMIALEKWKRKNKHHFLTWLEAVGEIEKLNSLATFHFNHPEYILPLVSDGNPYISATSIAHPLIPTANQVSNNIDVGKKEKLLLITGSNMSGKSTFLRTVGVNVLLAQCGLPVCAKSFSFTPMHLLTSIRISDSLQENTSYFMAELKRLADIIGWLESGKPALVLIDEVLRGTNSDDKTYGSQELIKKLSAYNCLAFFASHDLSLSALENSFPGIIKNYCFESVIRDGELLFDYKLREGVATNKNASFLMKKMGIIG
jgi:hypothetical protein